MTTAIPAAKDGGGEARAERLAAAAVAALALVAYLPALGCGWIWDDEFHVTANPLVQTWSGIADIWLEPTSIPQYYPLVHTTFWIEHRLWGLRPAGFHAVNVLLHALSAVLLVRALRRLALPLLAAVLAGALFAVHPVHVESVAWVTERKNVLSMAFYLGSGLLWLRWAGLAADGSGGEGQGRLWWGSLGLFALALLSKTVTASLPALLLVLAWWRSGSLGRRRVLSLVPFFAAGIAYGLFTAHLERNHVGAEGEEWALTPAQRVLVAGRAIWFYAWKLVLPVDLVFSYPRWSVSAGEAWQWLFPAAGAAVPLLLFALRGRLGRGPVAAVLAYGGTLFPALGFFNVYPFRYTYVADHFQYHASAGLLALAGAGLARVAAASDRIRPGASWALTAPVLVLLGALCVRQMGMYRGTIALWDATLRRNPDAWIAWNNLGFEAMKRGLPAEAEAMFRNSIRLNERNYEGWNNLGACLENAGRTDEALAAFEKAVAIMPAFSMAIGNLGRTLVRKGETGRAIEVLRRGADVAGSQWFGPHWDLVQAYRAAGRLDDAIATCREAARRFPGEPRFEPMLAELLLASGDAEGAAGILRAVAQRRPRSSTVRNDLAVALKALGRTDEAERQWREALLLDPGNSAARGSLARLLGGVGRTDEGAAVLRAAVDAAPDSVDARHELAAFLAGAGRHRDAAAEYRRALRMAPDRVALLHELAWILATSRDEAVRGPAEAVSLAEKAVAAGGKPDPWLLDTLAAAMAAAGQFDEAARKAEEALALSPPPDLTEDLRRHLESFRRGEALRE